MTSKQTVLVTGGGGYVGSVLVPKLLDAGHAVRVLDLFIYGREVLHDVIDNPRLELVAGDIRDQPLLRKCLPGCETVIHLACISNDPSFELNPELGKSINFDAFRPLVEIARDSGVSRFIYASSSSVYGVKSEPDVTETLKLEPLTDYSKFKAMCEDVLQEYQSPDFTTVTLRPATVCGYSPRLRLDLTVNILTNHAVTNRRIRVFGGSQYRPNLHIEDMTDLYVDLVQRPRGEVAGKIWNAGYDNMQVQAIADLIQTSLSPESIEVVAEPTDDLRSYRVNSELIRKEIGFTAQHSIRDAVDDLVAAFRADRIPNSMTDERYFNIRRMQSLQLG
ncbi:MAG: NAD-dependent epimerase/dehydratase family protein [Planctomycetota bacterium]|nr:NAD-dependent epimerase/dehydratase family protein [Planctomycetota bacterium]